MPAAARTAITLEECYRTLQLKPGADLEHIKKSFRKLAFSLHPDLNPGDPAASKKFQRLNEAYVVLKRVLEGEPAQKRAQGFRPGKPASGTAGQAGARSQDRPAGGSPGQDRTAGAAGQASGPGGEAQGARRRFNPYARQQAFSENPEDVLQDILKDPFARQVYEDIFRSAGKGAAADGKTARRPGAAQPSQPAPARDQVKRQISLEWGERSLTVDLSQGLWSGVKSWMSGQMDEEQTVYLPPHMLLPGKLIRIRVRRGLGGDAVPVEVRLPIDFVVGRPLRLKGLGRRIGPLKGDLYLRLLAR
jgi:molecular chaperone DnaJ